MSRVKYTKQLNQLKENVKLLAQLARSSFETGIDALVKRSKEIALKVVEINKEIDDLEFKIEQECIRLLALQQPVGFELRLISTALKIITDFDRIGDLSGNIAEIVIKSVHKPPVKPLIDIPRMKDIAGEMLDEVIGAFESGEIDKLTKLSEKDDIIDGLFDQIYRELITLMIENPKIISDATDLLLVARFLERIGDHTCNIASRIIYMYSGKRVKIK
ncbi:MAG: phosphate signaling complex protein PhoU [Candidatus Odinarchaeia archaeon]